VREYTRGELEQGNFKFIDIIDNIIKCIYIDLSSPYPLMGGEEECVIKHQLIFLDFLNRIDQFNSPQPPFDLIWVPTPPAPGEESDSVVELREHRGPNTESTAPTELESIRASPIRRISFDLSKLRLKEDTTSISSIKRIFSTYNDRVSPIKRIKILMPGEDSERVFYNEINKIGDSNIPANLFS